MSSACEQLLSAAVRRGAKTQLELGVTEAGVRGLFASKDIPAGTTLVSCPSNIALTMPYTDSAYAAPWLLREVLHYRKHRQHLGGSHQSQLQPTPCPNCGQVIWKSDLFPEFIDSLPQPGEFLTAYCWPDELLKHLACDELEAIVRLLKRRASRVFSTGLASVQSSTVTPCKGALYPLTLKQAELQANGVCPSCHEPNNKQAPVANTNGSVSNHHKPQPHRRKQRHTTSKKDEGFAYPGLADDSTWTKATLQDVQWAASLVCSRTFHSSMPNTMVMVPLLDMVNHVQEPGQPNASLESSSESDCDADSDNESDIQQTSSASRSPAGLPMPSHTNESDGSPAAGLNLLLSAMTIAESEAAQSPMKCSSNQHIKPGKHTKAQKSAGMRAPLKWLPSYRRRNSIRSKCHIQQGQEVLFTYHDELRDDECLIYYGFLPVHTASSHAQPWLCAVDHPEFSLPPINKALGDVPDETRRNLMIDPLNGVWRGEQALFEGNRKKAMAEMSRLQLRLEELQSRSASLNTPQEQAAARAVCDSVRMPWLYDVLVAFRERRAVALEAEISRLGQLLL